MMDAKDLEKSKENLTTLLDEMETEATQLLQNVKKLKEELAKVQTEEDAEKFDDLSNELLFSNNFKHIELF